MMKKVLKRILFMLALIVLAELLFKSFFYHPSEVTVSARFRIPVSENDPYHDYYLSQDNGYKTVRVHPRESIEIAEGGHDAPYQPAKMKNGLIRIDWEYGPDSLRGTIRKEDIVKVWPDAPIQEDWPFHISIYNTSTGRAFRMFLDISYDTETDTAEAVFYVFYPESATPVTGQWKGKPGEEVLVGMEL